MTEKKLKSEVYGDMIFWHDRTGQPKFSIFGKKSNLSFYNKEAELFNQVYTWALKSGIDLKNLTDQDKFTLCLYLDSI